MSETRDKLLPLVKQQTDKLEKAYETGQTDLLTVLRAREQQLQLETAVWMPAGTFTSRASVAMQPSGSALIACIEA